MVNNSKKNNNNYNNRHTKRIISKSAYLLIYNNSFSYLCRQVAGIVGNLKAMATDMGTELDRQNVQIDKITDKVSFI